MNPFPRGAEPAILEGKPYQRKHNHIHAQEIGEVAQRRQQLVAGQYDDQVAGDGQYKGAYHHRNR